MNKGKTFVIAAVKVVFPWSTCPIVPTLTWGLLQQQQRTVHVGTNQHQPIPNQEKGAHFRVKVAMDLHREAPKLEGDRSSPPPIEWEIEGDEEMEPPQRE